MTQPRPRSTGATPLVRQLAAQHGVDLTTLAGSGTGGRVSRDDVLAAARTAGTPRPAAGALPVPDGPGSPGTRQPNVTPLVKHLAAQHGVDLTTIDGTGVAGRIRKDDVLAAARTTAGPRAHAGGPTRVLPVAPRNAAETAEALGPRPYDYWLPGVPQPLHIMEAQAAWDAQVTAAETLEEYEEREARGLMHLGGRNGSLTFEEALARVRGSGDPGSQSVPWGGDAAGLEL